MNTKELGRFGEEQAAKYLRKNGYRIVEMNLRCRLGEIDIIAENREYLVFVEVKLRKNADFAEAREFVTYSKQRRIIATAQLWLTQHESDKQPRFDVVEVYAPGGARGALTINHIENAFSL